MRGSMRQRSPGSWELRVFVGRDPRRGTPRYRSRTVRGDREAAQRALAEMVGAVAVAPSTVAEVLERWFEEVGGSLSPSTRATTRVVLDAHVLVHLGPLPLAELTTERLDALYRHLAESGGRGGRSLSAATVRRAHNVVHAALAHAVGRGWLTANPAGACSLPATTPREAAPPTPAELRALLDHAEGHDPRLAVFVRLAAVTGARRAEVVALRWCDIDWDSTTVALGGRRRGDGEERRLCLDATTLELLGTHRAKAEAAAGACGMALGEDAFVFASSPDGRVSWPPSGVTQAFARLARRAGVPAARLDDLRHFAPAQLLDAGADARSVAARLPPSRWPFPRGAGRHAGHDAERHAADLIGRVLDDVDSG